MNHTRDTFAAAIRKEETLSRPISPKLYLGCDTCQIKNGINIKSRKSSEGEDVRPKTEPGFREGKRIEQDNTKAKVKIKLTDLCDEDKKKIVELIEELSKYSEKNKRLQESVHYLNKVRKEQQEYILKQASLFLKEKNVYLKEINNYKERLGYYETEMKGQTYKWEVHEKYMDNEICYLAKAIQRALDDKNDLLQQVNHLKQCLQQSLESFERLRNEVSQIQRSDSEKPENLKLSESQTDWKVVVLPEVEKKRIETIEEESEEDEVPPHPLKKDDTSRQSNMSFINDKLNSLYSLLKGKSDDILNGRTNNPLIEDSKMIDKMKEGTEKNLSLLKPVSEECSKTCMTAERILKKIEKPFNLNKEIESKDVKRKSSKDLYLEERILSELFYTSKGFEDHTDPVIFLNEEKFCEDPERMNWEN